MKHNLKTLRDEIATVSGRYYIDGLIEELQQLKQNHMKNDLNMLCWRPIDIRNFIDEILGVNQQ